MAGTIKGSIDHQLGDGLIAPPDTNQMAFKVIYDFFAVTMAGAGHCTLIANNYGASGTGTDFFDGANPFGENAWAVFRFGSSATPFYILVQWADAASIGTSPGNPGSGYATDGVYFQMALREDGGNPWNGGTAAAGADAKGTPVWTAGGSTLHVIDRSCAAGGSYATNKERLLGFFDVSGAYTARLHMIGDADGFFMLGDDDGDGNTEMYAFMGKYEVRTGLTAPYPYVALVESGFSHGIMPSGSASGSIWGSTADNTDRHGGVLVGAAEGVTQASLGHSAPWTDDTIYQPNGLLATPELDVSKVALFQRGVNSGLCGFLPIGLLGVVRNVSGNATNAANTAAYVCDMTTANYKYRIPWDGGSPPGTLTSRTGRQF